MRLTINNLHIQNKISNWAYNAQLKAFCKQSGFEKQTR